MKTYNQTNFFKHTFCEFIQVDNFVFPQKTNYKSKSDSLYFYTEDGVYRKSNHWGRVANCRWNLLSNNNYKNQKATVGFAKWIDFLPLNTLQKLFAIEVNYKLKQVKIIAQKENKNLYTFSQAHFKIKQIRKLFKETKWATYFDENIEDLRHDFILEILNTTKTLQEIKVGYK